MSTTIWNPGHYLDLTAKMAIDNLAKESRSHRGSAKPKPKPKKAESKQTVYRLAWRAPELR